LGQEKVVPPQYRTCSNETHSSQDAQRQAHRIECDEGVLRPPGCGEQGIAQNHGYAGGQRDQHSRSQTGWPAVLAAIQTDHESRNQRAQQSDSDVEPYQPYRHTN